MPETAEKIEIEGGYVVEIHWDGHPMNPIKEYDGQPYLILHDGWARNYDLGQDEHWCDLLRQVSEHGSRSKEWALRKFVRWVMAYHDVVAILPFSMLDHSGLSVYLGDGPHWSDSAGWDSGFAGFILMTRQQAEEWGTPPDLYEEALRGSFKEFADYVSNRVYGYVVTHEDGHEIDDDSCWGFYGDESYDEGGYMREQFMEVIERDREKRSEDDAETDEMRRAEVMA